jgi:general L-amino acid transport system substrate-binding protein
MNNDFLNKIFFSFWLLASLMCFKPARADDFFERVQKNGIVRCGIDPASHTLSKPKEIASFLFEGFDVDLCRALSLALFDDPSKAYFIPTTHKNPYKMLEDEEVDILMNVPITGRAESLYQIDFPVADFHTFIKMITFFDENKDSLKAFEGAKICVRDDLPVLESVDALNKTYHLNFKMIPVSSFEYGRDLFFAKECALYADYEITLKSPLLAQTSQGKQAAILPDSLRHIAFGPAIKKGNPKASELVRLLLHSLIVAEEKNLTQTNLTEAYSSPDKEVSQLLGLSPNAASRLGASDRWIYKVLQAYGNYGEIYERNCGEASDLKLPRGLNNLWHKGGLLWTPPLY